MIRALALTLCLIAGPALAGPRVIAGNPEPNSLTWIYDNQIEFTMSEEIDLKSVEVIDSAGRNVAVDFPKGRGSVFRVRLKAREKMGYPCGQMTVRWRTDGIWGEYGLEIRSHLPNCKPHH